MTLAQPITREKLLESNGLSHSYVGTTENVRIRNFQQFNQYLHERSILLENKALPEEQLKALGAAVMLEEDDWLDWKAARELLENWLGLRQEVGA